MRDFGEGLFGQNSSKNVLRNLAGDLPIGRAFAGEFGRGGGICR
jgi:hypothetical protein